MAHKPVAFRAVAAHDTAALVEVATQRDLGEDVLVRLRQPASATAVLPSGALLENLHADPGPLLRELRYRTCLEGPTASASEHLERAYFQPLRELRERWWRSPAAAALLAKQLAEQDFAIIDGFLPEAQVRRLREQNAELYHGSAMEKGGTTGGKQRVGLPHRGDHIKWVGYGGSAAEALHVNELAATVEEAIGVLRGSSKPEVAQALARVRWRSEVMLTCYPAETRARYFRHTDNSASSNNGRLLTTILYLNEGWRPGHGGELRLFHAGEQNLKVKAEIEPRWNRLIAFWSDERCPHEVLSACRDRYAATVWYYDNPNPRIPLYDLGAGGQQPVASSVAVEAAPPAHAAAAPVGAVDVVAQPMTPAAVPPPVAPAAVPPPSFAAAAPPPAPTAAPAPPPAGPVPALANDPIVFYDSLDWQAKQLAQSLASAQLVDLQTAAAPEHLRSNTEPKWGALLAKGVSQLCAETGSLFLVRPDGSLLLHGDRDRWMLQYELDYVKVRPQPRATQERLRETMLDPLARVRAAGGSPDQPWWATPAAINIWGPAMAAESFLVLDEFLPRPAVQGLAAAMQRIQGQMVRGRTDSQLSATGRGDRITWVNPGHMPEMGPLVAFLNALVNGMASLPQPELQARLAGVSALSDAQFATFPATSGSDARYIRHVDNEDGENGRLLTCTYYLNEGWDSDLHGGELRIFEPDQGTVKLDVAPLANRLVVFFSDSSVPHEVRCARRERSAITIWYLDQQKHLAYHASHGGQGR